MHSDIINTLLKNRGLITSEDQQKFLNPDWDRDLLNPFDIKDIDKAIQRIKTAIDNKEKIVIYSDYDCDGIPGGVVLYDFFKSIEKGYNNKIKQIKHTDNIKENFNEDLHIDFVNYIPHRHKEGYGINLNAINKFIKDNVSLIITVDLGITNIQEIQYAQDNGIDVIVTDHHLPLRDTTNQQILPPAFAIINTKREDCLYKEKMLCGCATAWKLASAFLVKHREYYGIKDGIEKWWLDMVGISTIADMVPLLGENRLLAKFGLKVLQKSKRPGLQKIINNAKIIQKDINESNIGFGIAPRLNAAGRMSDPIEAFLSLLDNEESVIYAERLEQYNKNRKTETNSANHSIDYNVINTEDILIIGDTQWSSGILGLIASNIVEKTGKTTFVWGKGENEYIMKGSVRSGKDGANVVILMSSCSDILEMFGGHEEAGGFAIHKDNINKFKDKLNIVYKNIKDSFKTKDNNIEADFVIESKDINLELYKNLNIIAPFGIANKKPIFKIQNNYKGHRIFGDKNQHLEIKIDHLSLIKFNISKDKVEDILKQNEYNIEIDWDNYKKQICLRLIQ